MLPASIFLLIALAEPRQPATFKPLYFADRLGEVLVPAAGEIDVTSAVQAVFDTPDGKLKIAYNRIRSLSFADSATDLNEKQFECLLTVGFAVDNGAHHNLVFELKPKAAAAILKKLSQRSGIPISRLR